MRTVKSYDKSVILIKEKSSQNPIENFAGTGKQKRIFFTNLSNEKVLQLGYK